MQNSNWIIVMAMNVVWMFWTTKMKEFAYDPFPFSGNKMDDSITVLK